MAKRSPKKGMIADRMPGPDPDDMARQSCFGYSEESMMRLESSSIAQE